MPRGPRLPRLPSSRVLYPAGPISDAPLLGIDPGLRGAWAMLNPVTGEIIDPIFDMPIYRATEGGLPRDTFDARGMLNLALYCVGQGVKLAVLENVGRRPGESSGRATTAGIGWGMVHMALICEGVRVEVVEANRWKPRMRVPGDKWGAVQRADQIWPDLYPKFRGPNGGIKDGRAEACLIAKFGALEYLGIRT